MANNYLKKELNKKERKYRLKIGFNKKIKQMSINKPLSSKVMFNNNYIQMSMSRTIQDHLNTCQNLKKNLNLKKY